MRNIVNLAASLLLWSATAIAPASPASPAPATALTPNGEAEAVEIVDGDTLILADGREVRLVGIQAPKLPLGRTGFRAWPLAAEAKRALADLALGKILTLSHGGREIDRHGRRLAHLHDKAGLWIQGALLARGMARVYSFADNTARVAEMLALERRARAERRGIWRLDFYAVRDAAAADRHIGGFELVEGRVVKVTPRRKRTYINFAEDWRRDFTISIRRRHLRRFEAAGFPLSALAGRRVRVRGWLKSWNGPHIEADHPEQIEILD